MRKHRTSVAALLSLGFVACGGLAAPAQEIHWRQSYNEARQEAKQKNLPIFMDIGIKNCNPCKQLEATTFRDPAVVKLINTHFIPLKLDGEKYASLVKALDIQAFPALVYATPQGKVVWIQPGFMKASDFAGLSQKILAGMDAAPAGGKDNSIQLTSGQKTGAATDRLGQARALLALAQDEFRTQQFVCCLLHCTMLTSSFADLPEAEQARQLAVKLKSDPERLRQTCDHLTQSLCDLYLELSASLIKNGQAALAAPYLQWICQACPGTPHAEAAQKMLQSATPASGPGLPLTSPVGKAIP